MKKAILFFFFFLGPLLHAASATKRLSITGLVGVPHPINAGLDFRISPKFSLGVTGGYLNVNLKWNTGDTFRLSTQNYEGRMRFFPFGGIFFLGVAGGYQTLTGDTNRDITSSGITVNIAASGQITNYYVIPHFGWFHVSSRGFTIGFELGVYVPFNPKTDVSLSSTNPLFSLVTSTPEYASLQSDVSKLGNDLANTTLPFLTLLRLGWSF